MILLELYSEPIEGMQDMANDATQYKITDTRKTRLTLAHINRLRKMNDMRALEQAKELQMIQKMYKTPLEGGGLTM